VKLAVVAQDAELVADIFQSAGAGGVIFEDPQILSQVQLSVGEMLSDAIFMNIPREFGVLAYFPVDDRLGERLAQLKKQIGFALGIATPFSLRQVQEEDWAEAWKQYFKPECIGRVVIKPSWENYQPKSDEIIIELDPGMAFGTGTHPTTRLCIQLLQEIVQPDLSMLDIGTGSGILALVAAKLGAKRVVATDIDPLAVQTALKNVIKNQVGERVCITEGNLFELPMVEKFDFVVANIIANTILAMIPNLDEILKPGGCFLASGIIEERQKEVEELLLKHGYLIRKTTSEEGWVAILACLTSGSEG
jgi:ribosomal protein L11 methyltransferase